MFYVVALICVIGIAAGQILFKLSAIAINESGSFFSTKAMMILSSAFALYGITTIAWVWVLQKIELSKAYPLMALAFVVVPIGSYFFIGEKIHAQYLIGVFFIFIGIIFTLRT